MSGQYQEQVRPGKSQTTGDQIANGAIELRHLSGGLFAEIRNIQLHKHTGVKSGRVSLAEIEGVFPAAGFLMYGTNSAKYRVTIVAGVLTVTAV